ncbi:synaptophysin-like protein 2 isoform X1 [Hypanus sabinus]|uniref:synaptophysin-like protein 2 isoform X1 n=1 Tax=Hypanus sabinus TaxID=79690 RepID=UPI0028C3C7A2|nr:synaptophysin-like protein 2 isoform X1 [Hypanus sabinus]
MEAVPFKKLAEFKLDLGPLMEPLGFIKVLEWIFAVFAFATCGGYSGASEASIKCTSGKDQLITIHFGYPFRLNRISYEALTCNNATGYQTFHLNGDFSSSSEFFVTIGVFTFMYCVAALLVYVGYQNLYQQNKYLPLADFAVTALFAFLWLVSSSAWAQGLSDVKYASNPSVLIGNVDTCQRQDVVCTPAALPRMGRLNASVIFGFMNFILWSGNSWFAYKETSWHKPGSPQGDAEQGSQAQY